MQGATRNSGWWRRVANGTLIVFIKWQTVGPSSSSGVGTLARAFNNLCSCSRCATQVTRGHRRQTKVAIVLTSVRSAGGERITEELSVLAAGGFCLSGYSLVRRNCRAPPSVAAVLPPPRVSPSVDIRMAISRSVNVSRPGFSGSESGASKLPAAEVRAVDKSSAARWPSSSSYMRVVARRQRTHGGPAGGQSMPMPRQCVGSRWLRYCIVGY